MSRIKNILAVTALLAGIAAVTNAPTVDARETAGVTCCYEEHSICLRGDIDKRNSYARDDAGSC